MIINKMLCLLQKAKAMGLTEIELWFDTEGRKFDYCYANIGSMYLEPDHAHNYKAMITLYEKDEIPSRFPHDPRLEPGGSFDDSGKEQKNGWGFWNKDYTKWFGPWDDFRDAEKFMAEYDQKQESEAKLPACPAFGDIGIVENNISAAIREGMGECWKKYPQILGYLQNAEKEIEAFWRNRAAEEKDSTAKKEM